jgi:hypothetical protein
VDRVHRRRGAISYDLEARHRGAAGTRVTILPPHVVHDGRAATTAGFRKRVLYVGTDVLDERLIGPAVDDPDVDDAALLRGLHTLHRTLRDPDETGDRSDDEIAADLRDLLDEHRFEPLTFGIAPHRYDVGLRIEAARRRLLEGEPAAQVAEGVGFHDQAHLTRHFKRHVGTRPARYASTAPTSIIGETSWK